MKRVFGAFEAAFDLLYLTAAIVIGLVLLFSTGGSPARALAGVMALVLAGGDAFHLLPRVRVCMTGNEAPLRRALGRGKQIASITMAVFYVLLFRIGLLLFTPGHSAPWSGTVAALTALRVILCLLPQNQWEERYPPVSWGIWRNIPFFLQGMLVTGLFFRFRAAAQGLGLAWLAIVLSFLFYLPVVLWANQNPKIGMLMLPKTCAYLWLLTMCLSL